MGRAPRTPRRFNGTERPGPLWILLLLFLTAAASDAWVVCPECDPVVTEVERRCESCGRSLAKDGQAVWLVFVALDDKDRALVWAGPDTLCDLMSAAGIQVGERGHGVRIPWDDVAFYLPESGVLQTRDGTVHEDPRLVSGGDNPLCLRSPRLPARLLVRPWVESEWIFTPTGETVSFGDVRVLATSWTFLQAGKQDWVRRVLGGGRALRPFASEDDRKEVMRLPVATRTADPVYPDIPRANLGGRVLVDILVDPNGDALCAVPVHPGMTSPSLQMAAIDAAYQWRFKPARRGRTEVHVWIPVPFDFSSE